MALLPYALRPSVVARRKALRQGILGPSALWKAIALVVFGRNALKKVFGRNAEVIARERLRTNQFVTVVNVAPRSRKERKRTGITRSVLERQALADVAVAKAARRGAGRRQRRASAG